MVQRPPWFARKHTRGRAGEASSTRPAGTSLPPPSDPLEFHVHGQKLSLPLLSCLVPMLRPVSTQSTLVHQSLSWFAVKSISVKFHAWRMGLFNLAGFSFSANRSDARCGACQQVHPCDVYGALVCCSSPHLRKWCDTMLTTMPAAWMDTIKEWWHDPATTGDECRHLMRHLMPISLHQRLLRAPTKQNEPPLLCKANFVEWQKSLFKRVGVALSLRNTPDYHTLVPRPFAPDNTPPEVHAEGAKSSQSGVPFIHMSPENESRT